MLISNASFTYGKQPVFQGVNLTINRGEVIAIVGSNGSGKTTLLKCMANIYQLTSGNIEKDEDESAVFVPDVPASYEYLTGYEYLVFIQSITKKKNKRRIDDILSMYTLYEHKDKLIKNYSHGMNQKLSLCAAMINNDSEYIILDEPLTGIDSDSQKVIVENFKGLVKKKCSIIFSTHQFDTLKGICDKVYFIDTKEIKNVDEL